jgi:hypothetical protein
VRHAARPVAAPCKQFICWRSSRYAEYFCSKELDTIRFHFHQVVDVVVTKNALSVAKKAVAVAMFKKSLFACENAVSVSKRYFSRKGY